MYSQNLWATYNGFEMKGLTVCMCVPLYHCREKMENSWSMQESYNNYMKAAGSIKNSTNRNYKQLTQQYNICRSFFIECTLASPSLVNNIQEQKTLESTGSAAVMQKLSSQPRNCMYLQLCGVGTVSCQLVSAYDMARDDPLLPLALYVVYNFCAMIVFRTESTHHKVQN